MANVNPGGIVVIPNGKPVKSRRWVKVTGLSPPSNLGVFNNTVDVAYKALAERTFMCDVGGGRFEPPLKTEWSSFVDAPMAAFLQQIVDTVDLVPELTIREVVDCYKGAKRERYERAERKYWRDGVSKMDAMLSMFVKFEKGDMSKAPRVINPRGEVYNLCLGKFLKVNEHRYFEAIARVFGQKHVVFKGMDNGEMAEEMHELWSSVKNCVAIGGDAKKFDMHVSEVALRFEHLFYLAPVAGSVVNALRIYQEVERMHLERPNPMWDSAHELAWLLVQQLDNRGVGYFQDGKVKFRVRGTRASGDLNTSLGNCLLMCAMTYGWSCTSRVPVKLVNNGDDCDYFISAEHEVAWRAGLDQYFASKGFRMVLEDTATSFESVEFCQSKPCLTAEGWKMVRNPKTLVTKGTMCLLPVQNVKTLRKWMMAIGVAEGSLARGVPVIQSFARCMRRNGIRCTRRMIDDAYAGSTRMFHADLLVNDLAITDQARISFEESWGILPHEQVALEDYFDHWTMGDEIGERVPGICACVRAQALDHVLPTLLDPAY